MGIPQSIRDVKRPVNTIVCMSGRPGPKQYAVRERSGVKYVKGKSPQPVNGKVIGHIFEGRFVPLQDSVATAVPDCLSYGGAKFAHASSSDLISELAQTFDLSDACRIFSLALLRVLKPSAPDSRMQSLYERCWLSRLLPNVALSKNSVSRFLSQLGKDGNRRRLFFQKRIEKIDPGHHIAIDGTLKQDSSKVNDLSNYSHKARVKGCRDVSVLYAYDIEKMEPLCAQVFPGNSIDASSYRSFVRDNKINKGVIVADKGFPSARIEEDPRQYPDLHFLSPLKRSDKRIVDFDLLNFEGTIKGMKNPILYKKFHYVDEEKEESRYFYSFKDKRIATAEDYNFLRKAEQDNDFDNIAYNEKARKFGVIVFESDLGLSAKAAYLCYQDRWLLELVFKRYKSDEGLDQTRVQGDFSVMGSEFVDFIATVITTRIIKEAERRGVLEEFSYGEMMEELNSAWRLVDAPEDAQSNDGCWVHVLKAPMRIMELLGLSRPAKPLRFEPKKRGRKKVVPDFVGPKRPRGRPRKTV